MSAENCSLNTNPPGPACASGQQIWCLLVAAFLVEWSQHYSRRRTSSSTQFTIIHSNMSQLRSLLFLALELLLVLCVVSAAPQAKKAGNKLPAFIKVCRRNDPQLNTCARNSMDSLKGRLANGVPELFIPKLEPLIIPELKLDQDSGAIYLHSTFRNISMRGLSNFTLSELTVDPGKAKLTFGMTFPNVTMESLYIMKGKIMMMPLVGEGTCKVNFTNFALHGTILGQYHKKDGRTFIKIKDIKMKYNMGKTKLRLDNLFNGDTALGERMNTFLNDNWDSLSEEVRPLMENAIAEIVRSSTDQLFDTYSYDDLVPE